MISRTKTLIIATALAFLVGAGIWFWQAGSDGVVFSQLNLASLFPNQESDSETFKYSNLYTNEKYSFSFNYPEGFKVSEFEDENGDVLLFEKDTKASFQIFIAPFDESGPLNPERVQKDLPQIEMKNPKNAELAGTTALHFESGRTRELWFVKDGFLYEVSYFPEFENMMFK